MKNFKDFVTEISYRPDVTNAQYGAAQDSFAGRLKSGAENLNKGFPPFKNAEVKAYQGRLSGYDYKLSGTAKLKTDSGKNLEMKLSGYQKEIGGNNNEIKILIKDVDIADSKSFNSEYLMFLKMNKIKSSFKDHIHYDDHFSSITVNTGLSISGFNDKEYKNSIKKLKVAIKFIKEFV